MSLDLVYKQYKNNKMIRSQTKPLNEYKGRENNLIQDSRL